ncbi:hypothetical protein E3W21_11080 [Pseudomonas sp. F01002]|nr:hypothetical protein CUN63_10085 [Pseudomonas sp. ACM7]TFB41682.1 hypothetical protein E3W21_11080 [Pseudomonas sp. F01002]
MDAWNAKPLVGAGLLAKAVDHSTLMLNVMASSRASPLPHLISGARTPPSRSSIILFSLYSHA